MTVHATDPLFDRAIRARQRRRRLEPWLLGLAGFSLAATAQLLLRQDAPFGHSAVVVAGQISAIAAN